MNKIKGPLELHFEAVLNEMDLPRVRDLKGDFKSLGESCDIVGIPYSFDLSRMNKHGEVEIYVLAKPQAIYLCYILKMEGFTATIVRMNDDISVINVVLVDWEDSDYWDVKHYIEDNATLCLVSVNDLIEFIQLFNDTLKATLDNNQDEEFVLEQFATAAVYGQVLARVKEDLNNSN